MSQDELQNQNVVSCPTCGCAAVVQGHTTKYYVAVNLDMLARIIDRMDFDSIIRDRLRRAEAIIVDLRKKLGISEESVMHLKRKIFLIDGGNRSNGN